ncbi:VanZ family protein [bacterium]|nr:VanZ family protein [bacterium]
MSQKTYIKLCLIYILFIIYATSIPFTFINSLTDFINKLSAVRWIPYIIGGRRESLTDIFSNIILFIPLGFCTASLLKKSGKIIFPLIISCLAGFIVSSTVEMLQLFTTERVSSITDILNNTLGAFCGSSAAILYHNKIYVFIKPYIQKFFQRPLIEIYTVLTGVGILFFAVLPFDISLDIDDIKRGIKFFLANFTIFPAWKYMQSSINNFFFFFIFSFLGVYSIFNRGLSWFTIRLFFLFNIFFAVSIEFMQLMIVSRGSTISNIFFAMLGSCLAIILSVYFYDKKTMLKTANKSFIITYCAYIFFNYMFPFKLTGNITDNISVISFVPFAMYFARTNLFSFADFFGQTFMFVPLGILAIMNQNRSAKKSFMVGFSSGMILEVIQAIIQSRYCDITDALMAGVGCCIGNYCVLRFYSFQNKLKSKDNIQN